MALFELTAFEAAYQALQPLDAAARRRALHWLSDALGVQQALAEAAPAVAEAPASVAPQTAAASRSGRGRPAQSGGRSRRPAGTASRRRRVRGGEAAGNERAYRRMPPPEDVLDAYRQVGTVSGLADHFGVPRHTVQGWARRLRGQGYQIGRQG
jgi:hypothetical protein